MDRVLEKSDLLRGTYLEQSHLDSIKLILEKGEKSDSESARALLEENERDRSEAIRVLLAEFELSEFEIYELIVLENIRYIEEDIMLLNWIYYFKFCNWKSILDKLINLIVLKYDGVFHELDECPEIYRNYILQNSCVNREKMDSCKSGDEALRAGHKSCLKKFRPQ